MSIFELRIPIHYESFGLHCKGETTWFDNGEVFCTCGFLGRKRTLAVVR